jgi:hypothetical protein
MDCNPDPFARLKAPYGPSRKEDIELIRAEAKTHDALEMDFIEGDYSSNYGKWRDSEGGREHTTRVDKHLRSATKSTRSYKLQWDCKLVKHEDVLVLLDAELTRRFSDEAQLNRELSDNARVFDCAGVTGMRGISGGGTTVFIKSKLILAGVHFAVKLKDKEHPDAPGWLWEADIYPDTLAGRNGKPVGTVKEDFYDPEMSRKMVNIRLTEALSQSLKELKGVRVSIRQVNHDRSRPAGDWTTDVLCYCELGSAERELRKQLHDGVNIKWQGKHCTLSIQGKRAAQQAKTKQQDSTYSRLEAEASEEKGRRLHIYKLRADIVDDAELQRSLVEECEEYGAVLKSGTKPSRDGCAWAWIVYEDTSAAQDALGNDALEDKLCSEQFTDGTVNVEESVWEQSTIYKKKAAIESGAPTLDLSSNRTYAGAAGGKADMSAMIKSVMIEREMRRQLASQIVEPVQQTMKEVTATQTKQLSKKLTALETKLDEILTNQAGDFIQPRSAPVPRKARRRPESRAVTPKRPAARNSNKPDAEAVLKKLRESPQGDLLIKSMMMEEDGDQDWADQDSDEEDDI